MAGLQPGRSGERRSLDLPVKPYERLVARAHDTSLCQIRHVVNGSGLENPGGGTSPVRLRPLPAPRPREIGSPTSLIVTIPGRAPPRTVERLPRPGAWRRDCK